MARLKIRRADRSILYFEIMIILLLDLLSFFVISVHRLNSSGSYSQYGDHSDCRRWTIFLSQTLCNNSVAFVKGGENLNMVLLIVRLWARYCGLLTGAVLYLLCCFWCCLVLQWPSRGAVVSLWNLRILFYLLCTAVPSDHWSGSLCWCWCCQCFWRQTLCSGYVFYLSGESMS